MVINWRADDMDVFSLIKSQILRSFLWKGIKQKKLGQKWLGK